MFKWSEIIKNPQILHNQRSSTYLSIQCDCCSNETHQLVKYLKTQLKRGYSNKFCSKKCFSLFYSKKNASCLYCEKNLKNSQKKYCSTSCAAKINNKKRKKTKNCIACNEPFPFRKEQKYCSLKCQQSFQNDIRVHEWLAGNDLGFSGKNILIKPFIRKYLFDTRGSACSLCKSDHKHPSDNKTINEIDHIDGNPKNNTITNLRILCPNCHALTPTFRARNKTSPRIR